MIGPYVYIAGPDVFLPDAVEIGREKKRLCAQYGFGGFYPFDNEVVATDPAVRVDQEIYKANLTLMRRADFGIFNLTPFRGVSADVGTVFEMGLFIGLQKPIFAYSNNVLSLLKRIEADPRVGYDASGDKPIDDLGLTIEDFDNADNLMIDCALREQGRCVHRMMCDDPLRDLTGFEICLREAQQAGLSRRPRLTA